MLRQGLRARSSSVSALSRWTIFTSGPGPCPRGCSFERRRGSRLAVTGGAHRLVRRASANKGPLPFRTEAVSQTNGIGAKQQRLGEPLETDASGELLRASVASARLICLDADTCSWRSITNNFRSVTFVKRPRREPSVSMRVARLPFASDNSRARAPTTLLAIPRAVIARIARAVLRGGSGLAIAAWLAALLAWASARASSVANSIISSAPARVRTRSCERRESGGSHWASPGRGLSPRSVSARAGVWRG